MNLVHFLPDDEIDYFTFSTEYTTFTPTILHKHCFKFLLGVTVVP